MTTMHDYYEILQVSPKADAEIIQAAYRRLAQKWHPDKNPGDPFAYERMKLLNEAYETLSDARRRREYDAGRTSSTQGGRRREEEPSHDTDEPFAPGSQSQPDDLKYETMTLPIKSMFFIGAFLFVIARGSELFWNPLSLMARIGGLAAFIGIPASLFYNYQKRKGLFVFAVLFMLAGAEQVYHRYVSEPRIEKLLSEMGETTSRFPATVSENPGAARATPEPAKTAKQFMDSGVAWLGKREYDKAIADFDDAIRLNPSSSFAYYKRGESWMIKSKRDKALADFSEAIRLDQSNAKAYRARGLMWRMKREYDKAIQDYDEAIRLNPSDQEAWAARGSAWEGKKEYDKAMLDYDEAIRLDPTGGGVYSSRASLWESKKEYAKAIKDYEAAIIRSSSQNSFDLWLAQRGLAWILATCPDGRFRDGERAVRLATKACEFWKWEDDWTLETLAAAYAEMGQFDEAVHFQQKALGMKTGAPGNYPLDRLELYKQRRPYRWNP